MRSQSKSILLLRPRTVTGSALLFLVLGSALTPSPLVATDWSTLFTAQDVRDHLATPAGRAEALEFCRRMGLTKVYVEAFRDGYQADAQTLTAARDAFRQADLKVSGCVTTTGLGKPSTGWEVVACYTHRSNQERLASIFRFAAGIFDEIMIDDFFFTDCECSECVAARGATSWRQYREKLMLEVSRDRVLGPARQVNPRVKIILKYPQWYDRFQDRGYSVEQESALYDRVWTGTELRDPSSAQWGHTQQYRGFFLYRWLADVAGEKNGGGWFDPYGTDPVFYLDQAYVTLVAGAPEVFLFHYGELVSSGSRAKAEALAAQRAELDALARLTGDWRGIPAYKPPSSDGGSESYIFDQIGMLAIPLLPTARFPESARAALFTTHALEDLDFVPRLASFLNAGKTAFVSGDLARRLNADPRLPVKTSTELTKGEYVKTADAGSGRLVIFSDELPQLAGVDDHNRVAQLTPTLREALDSLRKAVEGFTVTSEDAPPRVAVFPLGSRVAVANFTENVVACRLAGLDSKATQRRKLWGTPGTALSSDGMTLRLPPHGWMVVE